jgi:hypothetical protein
MSLKEKLLNIQAELKAPKGQYNSYGGYNYRSCEDILEAVKPLLKSNNCVLTITDGLEQIGERYYIRAAATITDAEGDESYTNVAYAREEETKKGMDGAQITGTASSYARKYALNGLFLIDDTKDADTDEHAKQTGAEPKEEKKATAKQIELLKGLVKDIDAMLKYYKVEKIEDLTTKQASETISKLKGAK